MEKVPQILNIKIYGRLFNVSDGFYIGTNLLTYQDPLPEAARIC
jgi:hypothetical protein